MLHRLDPDTLLLVLCALPPSALGALAQAHRFFRAPLGEGGHVAEHAARLVVASLAPHFFSTPKLPSALPTPTCRANVDKNDVDDEAAALSAALAAISISTSYRREASDYDDAARRHLDRTARWRRLAHAVASELDRLAEECARALPAPPRSLLPRPRVERMLAEDLSEARLVFPHLETVAPLYRAALALDADETARELARLDASSAVEARCVLTPLAKPRVTATALGAAVASTLLTLQRQVDYYMMRDRMRCGGSFCHRYRATSGRDDGVGGQGGGGDDLRQRMDVRESRALRGLDASGARVVLALGARRGADPEAPLLETVVVAGADDDTAPSSRRRAVVATSPLAHLTRSLRTATTKVRPELTCRVLIALGARAAAPRALDGRWTSELSHPAARTEAGGDGGGRDDDADQILRMGGSGGLPSWTAELGIAPEIRRIFALW